MANTVFYRTQNQVEVVVDIDGGTVAADAVSIVLEAAQGALIDAALLPGFLSYSDPDDDDTFEIMKITGVSTDTLTVDRAEDGTTGLAIPQGSTLQFRNNKALWNQYADALENGFETDGTFIIGTGGSIRFNDNVVAKFGTDSDFQVRCNGTLLQIGDGTNWPLSLTDNGTTFTFGLTGDIATAGAVLIGANTGSDIAASVNGAAASFRGFYWRTAGLLRWGMYADNVAESGSNAGSALKISAYNDAGSIIDTPFSLLRVGAGALTVSRPVTLSSTLTVSSDADATTILGRAKVGSPGADAAYFSHFDNLSTTNYAVLQSAAGATALNASAANSVTLRVNNSAILTGTSALVTVNIGALDAGVSATTRGAITAFHGAAGNTPGYLLLYSPNGTAHYFFVEDDGTLKQHTSAPAANTDGNVVGAQT